MVFQGVDCGTLPVKLLIFRYVVDKNEFRKNAKSHQKKSRDGLDDALLSIGWGTHGEDGERRVVSQDLALTYYSYIKGSHHILEYRVSKGDHPFLHPEEFWEANV